MTSKSALRQWIVFVAVWGMVPAITGAAAFQFEVLGISDDWIMIRENIPATETDTAACSYPGLDSSKHVGVRVYFMSLSAEAKRGQLTPFDTQSSSMTLYSPARHGEECTSTQDAEGRWRAIISRAESLGIHISSSPPVAVVLGEAVPAKACVLIEGAGMDEPPCRRVFTDSLKEDTVRIAVSLAAVPEAPDLRFCQFVGQRFGAVIQVDRLDRFGVLLGSFRGTNIADHDEYPFLILFPIRRFTLDPL